MITKTLFYSLMVLMIAGVASLIKMENTLLADVITLNSSLTSIELRPETPCEGCYEEEEVEELTAEFEITYF